MKYIIYFSIIFLLYLAYCCLIDYSKEGFVLDQKGVSSICTPEMAEYTNANICFDISYTDPTTNVIKQAKAKISPGYFIGPSGLLDVVPYGYTASRDKRSYIAVEVLNKSKVSTGNKTSNTSYNSDNLNVTYHTDPTKETPPDANNLLVGQMWIKDASGNLKSVPYSDVKNTTHYYPAGSYIFNPPTYIPNYEDSVFLSKMSNLPTDISDNKPRTDDFCAGTASSTLNREMRCNGLNKESCGKSNCCVLFGNSKCVAGDAMGPSIKSNYSDTTLINRDFYYYKGTCYGNCPNARL
jgi:hypothetical protein